MSWWGWTIAGAILLGAELAFVDVQFYFVFIGSAAIAVGLLLVAWPDLAPWMQWASFAVLAIVSMLTFRARVYRKLRGHAPAVHAGPPSGLITLQVPLAPGESCQSEHGGTYWTVRNDSPAQLPSGARVRITGVQGLTLLVRPAG
jgi:membrane protein implicated in regulation of membrane protease activity